MSTSQTAPAMRSSMLCALQLSPRTQIAILFVVETSQQIEWPEDLKSKHNMLTRKIILQPVNQKLKVCKYKGKSVFLADMLK